MTKVLVWLKAKYHWESKETEKAYRTTLYVTMGMLIIYGILAGVGEYLNLGQTFRTIIGISASGLVCFFLGYASALQWTDKKLKSQ